jgi:endonuclease/exonuclease/phosphatase family metal-dependent hydrolase
MTMNVTRAEQSQFVQSEEMLRPISRGGGFRPTGTIILIGDLYEIHFAQTTLSENHAPTTECHKLVLLASKPNLLHSLEHSHITCSNTPPPLIYSYGGLDIPDLDVGATEKPKLDVMSYNTWNFEAKYPERLELITSDISEAAPDVVGLQEMRWSNHEYPGPFRRGSMADDLAEVLFTMGYKYWSWRPAMLYHKGGYGQTLEGLGVFSKFPITQVESFPLTRFNGETEDYHQRLLLRVAIDTPMGVVNVFNSHFSLFQAARDESCVEVRDHMAYYEKHGPVILMGDLNAEISTSNGLKYLLGEKTIAASTGFLSDSFDWITSSTNLTPTEKSKLETETHWTFTTLHKKPKKRIDFIFHSLDHTAVEQYASFEIASKNRTIQSSDHRPIMVRLVPAQ